MPDSLQEVTLRNKHLPIHSVNLKCLIQKLYSYFSLLEDIRHRQNEGQKRTIQEVNQKWQILLLAMMYSGLSVRSLPKDEALHQVEILKTLATLLMVGYDRGEKGTPQSRYVRIFKTSFSNLLNADSYQT